MGNSNISNNISHQAVEDEIELQVVKAEDRQRALELLRKYFFSDEPLTGSTEPKGIAQFEEEEFVLSNIQYGTCIKAVRKDTNEMIGVCMAGPQGPDATDHLFEEAAKEGDTKWGKVLKFLACIERDAEVCKRYNVEKILYIISTCVDSSMRGQNIRARLCNAVRDMGREKGFELLRADCTSFYTAAIKERLGWDLIHTVHYKDYVNSNKKPIFNPPAPHDCCKSYAKRL